MRSCCCCCFIACALPALAQDWPKQKPIHIVVGFAPASTTDLVARLVRPSSREALGQTVVVENKPGAGGNVAAQQVKRAAPDGYTLFVTSVAYAVNPSLYAERRLRPVHRLHAGDPRRRARRTSSPSTPRCRRRTCRSWSSSRARRSCPTPPRASAPPRTSRWSASRWRRRSTSRTCPTSRRRRWAPRSPATRRSPAPRCRRR